jgi:hypothetical protein
MLPTLFASPTPQEESFVRFPNFLPAPVLQPSIEGIFVALQTPGEDIVNMMESTLIVKRIFCMLHIRVMKNLRKRILWKEIMQMMR